MDHGFLVATNAIDLHSHILPGLDDGAADAETSLAMARVAVADGVRTIVATPHVSDRYDSSVEQIERLGGELNIRLARAEIPLAVLPGAEVALSRLGGLTDHVLRGLCLGRGPGLLVESPYQRGVAFLDDVMFDLQVRGFNPVLAHPERCPLFQEDIDRLRGLVRRGVLCSVNAGSMAGIFGSTVRRFVLRLLREGLVHDVSSDSHDHRHRSPVLSIGFERAEAELPGISRQAAWLTSAAPAAILAGNPLPRRPELPTPRRSLWTRLAGRH